MPLTTYMCVAEFDAECERLQAAVDEGRSKIHRLEEEIFELKCARRRQDPAEVSLTAGPRFQSVSV